MLRGWPALVWRAALLCDAHLLPIAGAIAGLVVVGILACGRSRSLRWLFWLAAALTVLLDAGIVFITLRTALKANAQAAGLEGVI